MPRRTTSCMHLKKILGTFFSVLGPAKGQLRIIWRILGQKGKTRVIWLITIQLASTRLNSNLMMLLHISAKYVHKCYLSCSALQILHDWKASLSCFLWPCWILCSRHFIVRYQLLPIVPPKIHGILLIPFYVLSLLVFFESSLNSMCFALFRAGIPCKLRVCTWQAVSPPPYRGAWWFYL